MRKTFLNNSIPLILKKNENTPRIAMCLYFKIDKPEEKAGLYTILNRLFLQGTTNRSGEELAQELDENAIECYSEMKHDFIRFKILCLNEDFEKALELLSDIIYNSNFEEFEKEVVKLNGEIDAELDAPKAKAADAFYKTLFKKFPYGHTYTESLPLITKEEVKETYKNLKETSSKIISVVGDFDEQEITDTLNKHFSDLTNTDNTIREPETVQPEKSEFIKVEKDDASQAQIFKGWLVPTIFSEDYAPLMVLNTILGSSGLSSRLFVELRDKKGLAYVVRSTYEVYNKAAAFSVYIATEPKNIKTSLEGFKFEIDRIKNEPVSETELENAKNNLIGKREFFTETNLQQCSLISFYEDKNLGFDYEKEFIKAVKKITPEDIKRVAAKYLTEPSIMTVLAPKQYLPED